MINNRWGEISNTKIDYDEYVLPDKYKIELHMISKHQKKIILIKKV